MNRHSILLAAAAVLVSAFAGCGSTDEIGASLVQDKIEVKIVSSFTVTGHSVVTERVQSRTTSQLLGRFDAPGFGRFSSNIVTQFMPASKLFSSEVTVSDIDSLVLYMFMANGEYVGDSIVPMGLEVYRLNRDLPSPIYSDFDPEGYYDSTAPIASSIYNISKRTAQISADTTYAAGVEISAKLPLDLGREIYKSYLDNPSNFLSPTAFANNVFKGLYIKNSFGSGRLIRASQTMMTLYYTHYDAENDTIIKGEGNYFAVTPEIITNNEVDLELSDDIKARVAKGENIVLAPVGLEVQMRFPAPELIAAYRGSGADLTVLNSLTFKLPASAIANDFKIQIPTYLLMILQKDREKFFNNNQLPDNITSFYATFDWEKMVYDFGEMRNYLVDLLDKDQITEEDYTFDLIPVSAQFDTSGSSYYYQQTTLSMMTPYMASPVMAQLKLDKAKIRLTFSTQTIEK